MSDQTPYPQQPQTPPAYAAPAPGVTPGPGEPFDGATGPDDLMRPLYGASFGQAVKRFFKNYANFSGRASRSEFWWMALFTFLVQLIPGIIYAVGLGGVIAATATNVSVDGSGNVTTAPGAEAAVGSSAVIVGIGAVLIGIIALAMLVPSIAINWRRLHDANLAGPFWFLSLTSVGSIVVIIFTLLPSKPMGRRFDRAR